MQASAEPAPAVAVEFAAAAEGDDSAYVTQLVELINRVYADAEQGLWREGVERTDRAEMAAIVKAGELAVARSDGRVVGAIRVRRLDPGLGEFGMLVASPDHRGAGVGRELVAFAEGLGPRAGARPDAARTARAADVDPPGQGVPPRLVHPDRLSQVRTEPFADAYPALQPQLATPCDFVIYHKTLI